jgi:hypothetical protein
MRGKGGPDGILSHFRAPARRSVFVRTTLPRSIQSAMKSLTHVLSAREETTQKKRVNAPANRAGTAARGASCGDTLNASALRAGLAGTSVACDHSQGGVRKL